MAQPIAPNLEGDCKTMTEENANAVSFASSLMTLPGHIGNALSSIANHLKNFPLTPSSHSTSASSETSEASSSSGSIMDGQNEESSSSLQSQSSQNSPDPKEANSENQANSTVSANENPNFEKPKNSQQAQKTQNEPTRHHRRQTREQQHAVHHAAAALSRLSRFIGSALPSFDWRSRLSSLVDYVIPDFTQDATIFDTGDMDFFGVNRGGDKFLSLYSVEDCTKIIANSPLGEKLTKLGYTDWYVELDLSDCFSHSAYLRSRSLTEKMQYLGFLIVQNGQFRLLQPGPTDSPGKQLILRRFDPGSLNMLNIRWFSLQNPRLPFSPKKPRLPGQRFPGSGMARDALMIFCKLGLKNGRDGIVNSPEHFHNAFLYAGFNFLNPEEQGAFERMKKDLAKDIKERSLAAVSWAIYLGFLRTGEQFVGRNRSESSDVGTFDSHTNSKQNSQISENNQNNQNSDKGQNSEKTEISENEPKFSDYLRKTKENEEGLVKWELHEQVFPLSLKMKLFFESNEYKTLERKAEKESGPFTILWKEAEKYCLTTIIQFSEAENQTTQKA